MKEKIKELLSFPHHYLMANGGEGMEFLSTMISYYSDQYRSNLTSNHITQNNRFIVNPPDFYDLLAAIGNHDNSWTVDQLIDRIHDRLPNFKPNLSMQDIIDEALSFNKESQLPCLHRQHFLNCDYFTKDNTYFLYLNSYDWYSYRKWLHFHKVWSTPLRTEAEVNNVIKFYYVYAVNSTKKSLLDQFKEQINNNPGLVVYEGHLQAITHMPNEVLTLPKDFIYQLPIELFEHARRTLPAGYQAYVNTLNNQHMHDRFNMIKYDGLVENLIKTFNIPTSNQSEFTSQVTEWYNKNINLISNNMDVSRLAI